jgi:hypothetical protein
MLKRQRAEIHPVAHSFSPPYFYYHFNPYLAKKDRNFLTWLKENNFDNPEAAYEAFNQKLISALKDKGKFHFKGIGIVKEEKGKVLFEPEHSKEDEAINETFFGLPEFSSPSVIKSPTAKPEPQKINTPFSIAKKPVETGKPVLTVSKPKEKREDEPEKEKKKNKWLWAATILLALSATLLLIALDASIKPLEADAQKVNILLKKWLTAESAVELDPVLTEDFGRFDAQPVLNLKTTSSAETNPNGGIPEPENAASDSESSTVKQGYYLILGSFKEKSNAELLKNNLLLEGVDAHIFFASGKGFYRTGYFIGNDEKEAIEILEIAKSQSPGVWLLSQ